MAEISKSPIDLANNLIESNAIIGSEVDVPFQNGVKGKITNEIGDTYEVEYTSPKSGVVRREQFYKDAINNRTKKKIQDQVDDGVTEDDIGYLRNVLNDMPEIGQLSNDQLRKIISSIIKKKK